MKHIVLIEVPDRKGLIHDITGIFTKHGLNIVSNGEFTNKKQGLFFMRSELAGECDQTQLQSDLSELLPDAGTIRVTDDRPKDVVILVTQESHCIGDLLMRHYGGQLNVNIKAVIGNHDKLGSLIEKFGIPFQCIPHKGMERRDHEDAVMAAVAQHSPEYIVLAKYMLVLTPTFVAAYPHRIINIHHSFLPAFIGARPYRQAYRRGVKIIGATAHFVTDDLDEGPIITQKILPVDHSHSVNDMSQAGRDSEKFALSTALKLVFEDRVHVNGNRTIIFD